MSKVLTVIQRLKPQPFHPSPFTIHVFPPLPPLPPLPSACQSIAPKITNNTTAPAAASIAYGIWVRTWSM
jgi:hypothetical protein